MNRTLSALATLGAAGLATLLTASVSMAQAQAAAPQPVPAVAAPAAAPQAIDAKIGLINFEQVVMASNEGQTVAANTQKKFLPRRDEIEKEAADVDGLKKNLEAAKTISDEDRASRLRDIDNKEKKLNSDAEFASNQYNTELQEALSKVAQKLNVVMQSYARANGYTILLDVSAQTSNVVFALDQTNISQAVVDAYNKQSGVPAPPPPAPRPANAARPAPRPAGK